MTTAFSVFDKFQTNLHNGQDYLKNHIFDKFPILYTDNPNDLTQVWDRNLDTEYVWLVDKNIKIYDSFPWFFRPKPDAQVAIHAYPYVYKKSRDVKDWNRVRLVPTKPGEYEVTQHPHICGHYDPYKGVDKFDIFYIGKNKDNLKQLEERGLSIQVVEDYKSARQQSYTDMFWIVYDDTVVRETFKFSYTPDEWSTDFVHVFGNGDIDTLDGIALCPKSYNPSKKELDNRFFINKKEIRILASNPRKYDKFEMDNYQSYLHMMRHSTTDLFWGIPKDIVIDDNFKFDFYIPYHNVADKKQNHAWLNGNKYDGIYLFSKEAIITENEFNYRFLVNKIEHDVVASKPKDFERFTIDTYEQYRSAIESCGTSMFWAIPSDVKVSPDFAWDEYINNLDSLDRSTNHVFLNGDSYDGIVLMNTKEFVNDKEIRHRFYTNKKEHEVIASTPKPYDKFTIDTYEDYTTALYHTESEMFWGVPSDVNVAEDFDFSLYFSYHNQYDRNMNHVFLNGENYDGIVLYSKNLLVSEKEVEHRFYIKKKEWEVIASNPKPFPVYTINDYEDYLNVKNETSADMFYMINDNINLKDEFNFDLYISHHNQYERKINHVWKNGEFYDGVALTSKHINLSQREIDYRFYAVKKEYEEIASLPVPYDIVFIQNGEPNADENYATLLQRFPRAKRVQNIKGIHQAHQRAAELVDTEMFWVVDADAEILEEFDFNYYVPAYDIDGKDTVHVWRSFNPVNGLVYGYGGVKLLPTRLTRTMDMTTTDMTTSISDKFKSIPAMSNVTNFNTDAYSAWRSGFRECAKLASKTIARQEDDETEFRLNAWCTRGDDKPFGRAAIAGAKAGREFGETYKDNKEELEKINNFHWLHDQFIKLYQST